MFIPFYRPAAQKKSDWSLSLYYKGSVLMEAPRPKQARSERTRAGIVDAAARTLATQGFHKASTQAVAGAAGVSQGALFKHFPQKSLLLAACVERILAGFV